MNLYTTTALQATKEQKLQTVKFSDYTTKAGFERVYTKNENGIPCGFNGLFAMCAFEIPMFENIYTIDGRLIANRIN